MENIKQEFKRLKEGYRKKIESEVKRKIDEGKKNVDNVLGQSEKKFRDLYDNAPIGYHTTDSDGFILDINNTEIEWLGYSKEEVVGKMTIFELQTEESAKIGRKLFENELKKENGLYDIELTMKRKDGTSFPVLLNATVICDDNGKFIMSRSTIVNITKHKKMEQDLLESNINQQEIAQKLKDAYYDLTLEHNEAIKTKDFLRNVVDSSSRLIISIDISGRITEWNRTAELITGYKSKDVKRKKISNLEFVENKKEIEAYIRDILNNKNNDTFELCIWNKNRRKKIILLSASLLKDDENNIGGLVIIGKDITLKKGLHKQLSPGNSYLVKSPTTEKIYDVFKNKIDIGFKGLCITRNNPEIIKEQYSLDVPILWLSSHKNENFENISDLDAALNKAFDFLRGNENKIILLERIDYLVNMYSFEKILRFIYSLNDKVVVTNSILMIHINADTLNPLQVSMIEQEIQKIPESDEKERELTEDLQEIIEFIDMQKSMNKTISFKDITRKFDITKSTARRRINKLQAFDIVDVKKSGRFKLISLNKESISA